MSETWQELPFKHSYTLETKDGAIKTLADFKIEWRETSQGGVEVKPTFFGSIPGIECKTFLLAVSSSEMPILINFDASELTREKVQAIKEGKAIRPYSMLDLDYHGFTRIGSLSP